MADEATRVLIVDDEADLCRLLAFNLDGAGFRSTTATTATEALARAEQDRPAVVLLDLMLPDLPGTEVCRRLRAHPQLSDVGILVLTARNDDYDRIVGFELGADDYVVKPFNVRELVLRVRALARRVGERSAARAASAAGDVLAWRGLRIDTGRHRVMAAGDVEVTLRPLEYRLLLALVQAGGAVLSRERLIDDVWGTAVHERTVDTHVKRLRQRLGAYGDGIETVFGFGYRVKDD
ncbi:MAG: response regulator [Deltaproteobacteria bacterium]|nr:response regulator [Deltaproteobacteria bacterium]